MGFLRRLFNRPDATEVAPAPEAPSGSPEVNPDTGGDPLAVTYPIDAPTPEGIIIQGGMQTEGDPLAVTYPIDAPNPDGVVVQGGLVSDGGFSDGTDTLSLGPKQDDPAGMGVTDGTDTLAIGPKHDDPAGLTGSDSDPLAIGPKHDDPAGLTGSDSDPLAIGPKHDDPAGSTTATLGGPGDGGGGGDPGDLGVVVQGGLNPSISAADGVVVQGGMTTGDTASTVVGPGSPGGGGGDVGVVVQGGMTAPDSTTSTVVGPGSPGGGGGGDTGSDSSLDDEPSTLLDVGSTSDTSTPDASFDLGDASGAEFDSSTLEP